MLVTADFRAPDLGEGQKRVLVSWGMPARPTPSLQAQLGRAPPEGPFALSAPLQQLASGRKILVLRHHGELFAMDAHCFHMGAELAGGDIEDVASAHPCIVCPAHRYRVSGARLGRRACALRGAEGRATAGLVCKMAAVGAAGARAGPAPELLLYSPVIRLQRTQRLAPDSRPWRVAAGLWVVARNLLGG